MTSALQRVLDYHQRTKHQPGRPAAGPHGLDWDNQPEPFRTWVDAETVELPVRGEQVRTDFDALYRPGAATPEEVTSDSLATLLELSLGLAAWKSIGPERWALRCNPSSGNLHPTEGYLVCGDLGGLAGGVYHYVSRDHLLERRAEPVAARWADAWEPLPAGAVLGLSSIHWRESWKYGERAFRYCQLDVGQAVGAVAYAAAALGWQACWLSRWSDEDVAQLLGLPRSDDPDGPEPESPDLLLWVGPQLAAPAPEALLDGLEGAQWRGEPVRLSVRRRAWPVIEETARDCWRASREPGGGEDGDAPAEERPPLAPLSDAPAVQLIRQRRSGQAYDGVTSLDRAAFYRLLDATLPRPDVPPLAPLSWAPRVHLLLFVHRVRDLEPGLYFLARRSGVADRLREATKRVHEWTPVPGAPAHLDLHQLRAEDLRELAAALSCRQDIAGDSAFSLGMVAELEETLAQGPWWYRYLHWEAGAVGQALYLDAEAAGLRGTGIGCYFDDVVHRLLGEGAGLQSLYHFTVGGAIRDRRLSSHPPYEHLTGR